MWLQAGAGNRGKCSTVQGVFGKQQDSAKRKKGKRALFS